MGLNSRSNTKVRRKYLEIRKQSLLARNYAASGWKQKRIKSGGEGEIRTPGTGGSPYNGLTKGSFSPPSLVFKSLQSELIRLSRTQGLSFRTHCAPFCAPLLIQR
jgi:hypothetical protein